MNIEQSNSLDLFHLFCFYLRERHGRVDRSRGKEGLLLQGLLYWLLNGQGLLYRLLPRQLLLNRGRACKLLLQELLLEKPKLLLLLNLEA